jgi:DNA polymerase (family 10)
MAIERGVKIAIDCDAHSAGEFELLPYGVATAQRGWVTAADVVNTWPIDQLLSYINSHSRGE